MRYIAAESGSNRKKKTKRLGTSAPEAKVSGQMNGLSGTNQMSGSKTREDLGGRDLLEDPQERK